MPASSTNGGDGGRALSAVELADSGTSPLEARPRRTRVRPVDLAFLLPFAGLFVLAAFAVAIGFGSYLASISDGLHETFHMRALGSGQRARAYERMAHAAHVMPSVAVVWLAFAFSLLNFALATLLLWLRPRDRTARLLAVGMVGTAAIFNLPAQSTIEILPLTASETGVHISVHILTGLAYTFALLLFPDGRLIPRWSWPAQTMLYTPLVMASVVLAWMVEGRARPGVLLLFFGLVVPVAGVAAQAYRFRTSDDPGRHRQSRLLFWALVPAIGVGLWFLATQGFGSIEPGLAGRHLPEQPVAVFRVFLPVFLLVPLALFAGILRYRLWDIDRVINRTVVYGVVTGVLLGAYVGIVIVLQGLLRPFTAGNDIAIATSTLLVAAAFIPVRRRVQVFVDRRFYRHRYDIQETIEAFTTNLRSEVDMSAVAGELRSTIARTMQPSNISLFMKSPEGGMEWQWSYKS
jgi:uncharacterized membrane protein